MKCGIKYINRPLIPIAIIYVIATVVGFIPCDGFFVLISFLFCVASIFIAIFKSNYRYLFSFLAIAFFAYSRSLSFSVPLNEAEELFISEFNETDNRVTAVGEIYFIRSSETNDYGRVEHRLSIKDVSFRARGDLYRISKPISVYWSTPLLEEDGGITPKPGMLIELSGYVYRRLYADIDNLSLEDLYIVSGSYASRIIEKERKYVAFLEDFRDNSAKLLSFGLDRYPEERDLILAMTLGMRSTVSRELIEDFRRAGTIHLFAISGLHVGVIAILLVWLISFLGVSRKLVVIPLAPLLLTYVCMTGMQPSACRAALMIVIYYSALLFNRKPDILSSLAATIIILLFVNPLQISDLSLILSIMMVLGIILYTGPVHRLFKRITHIDQALNERNSVAFIEANGDSLVRVRRWPRDFFIGTFNVLISCFSAAFAAGLVSFPLTAYFFGLLTPYSILANMFAVPISPFLMSTAGLGLFVAHIFPKVAIITNYLAAFFAWMMKIISSTVANLPFSSFITAFPLWALVIWYLALFLLFRGIPGILDPIINSSSNDEGLEDL